MRILAMALGAATSFVLVAAACGADLDAPASAPPPEVDSSTPPPSVATDAGNDAPEDASVAEPTCDQPITGKLLDPAGKLPVPHARVYFTKVDPSPLTPGLGDDAACDRCAELPPGGTRTAVDGTFSLTDAPLAGVKLVAQVGKWRRIVSLPDITTCAPRTVDLRLPKNRSEGDMPRIALSTGAADALECLIRQVGVDDAEIGTAGSEARIHLYRGAGTGQTSAFQKQDGGVFDGGTFANATTLWGDVDELSKYDLVMLSCEGGENAATKPQPAVDAVGAYLDKGGRLYAEHWQTVFFKNSQNAAFKALATFDSFADPPNPSDGTLNQQLPRAAALAEWLSSTQSLQPNGTLKLSQPQDNIATLGTNARSWLTVLNGVTTKPVLFSFTTPVGVTADKVCGRGIFTNLHVTGGSVPGQPFPSGCAATEPTAQEKALEYVLFDLGGCVKSEDEAP